MPTPQRPISPHLQIYKPQITTVLSILHRITGVILAFSAFGMAWWLWLFAMSQNDQGLAYDRLMQLVDSLPGRLLIVGFTWCLIYHLLNGIRHLFWDAGKGFEIKQFTVSGWGVVVLSVVLTAGYWALAMGHGGMQ